MSWISTTFTRRRTEMDGHKAKVIVERLKQLTENEEIWWSVWPEGKFYYAWDNDSPDGSVVIETDGTLIMRGKTAGEGDRLLATQDKGTDYLYQEGYRLLATQDKGTDYLYQVVARKTQEIALRHIAEVEATHAREEVLAQNALLRHLQTLEEKQSVLSCDAKAKEA
jgi:hypothetical protein